MKHPASDSWPISWPETSVRQSWLTVAAGFLFLSAQSLIGGLINVSYIAQPGQRDVVDEFGTVLPAGNEVVCTLQDPRVPGMAKEMGNTRSAAALELWRPHLQGHTPGPLQRPVQSTHTRALRNMRIQGASSPQSSGCQEF